MASILTHEIIKNAISEVDAYSASVKSLYQELEGIINTLTTNNFTGDASNGYKFFFNDKVAPALKENLTEPGSSLMASIKSMLESIQAQLLDTVDPQLGENNRNPGAGN